MAQATPSMPAPDCDLVEIMVITTARLSSSSSVVEALRELVDASRLRILDLVGVETDVSGDYVVVEPDPLPVIPRLEDVEGEFGGLLSEDDIALACSALPPGSSALILVVEDCWAQVLADAARAGGGRIAGGERIPRHRIEQSRRPGPRHQEQAGA